MFTSVCLLLLSSVVAFDPHPKQRTFEEMLPCRDGVKLHTRGIFPKDYDGTQKYTTIVDRSPYGYGDLEWIPDLFLPFGFVTIGQDMRGTKTSEGNFTIWHSDNDDSEDLGDWIVEQSWSNGEIFSFGASADGLAAFTTDFNEPSWLKAQYYIWTSALGFEVIFPNGAYLFDLADHWIRGTVENEDPEPVLQTIKENEFMNEWWDPIEMSGKFDRVHTNSGFWAGWYDIFLVGNLASYEGFNYHSDPAVLHQSVITIDPLGHCQKAAEYFKPDLIAGRTLLGFMQSFEVYGIRPVSRPNVKNVTFYVMSSNDDAGNDAGGFWTTMEKFPEPVMTNFYAHGDGSASLEKPSDANAEASTYTYDPTDPVPTRGGNNLFDPCGPLDQAEIDTRSDVLLFQTSPLEDELPVTGPLTATMFVSSDAIDTDFVVRISDVYPTGEARLIQDSALRMRWREGGQTPVYMSGADEVYEVTMSLWNTSYVFAPGHSIRFAVTSSNYPRFSINRNNGALLGDADQGANVTAHQVFHHSAEHASYFSLPVVEKAQLPEMHGIQAMFEAAYPQADVDAILKMDLSLLDRIKNPIGRK